MNFSDEKTLKSIREAEIIIGLDTRSGRTEIFFGTALLKLHGAQKVLHRGEVLFFALDYRTDEPARLAVAVLAVKGSCDTVRGGAG